MFNLYHIQYFVDAVQTGSIAQAAKKHRISQSAVSQAIRSLEKTFGFLLTSHERKVTRLSSEGKTVLQECKDLLEKAETLAVFGQDIQAGCTGDVVIGCTNSLMMSMMPRYRKCVRQRHPRFHLTFKLGNSDIIRHWLGSGEIDIGVMVDDGKGKGNFHCERLAQGQYVLFKSRRLKGDGMTQGITVTRKERPEIHYFTQQFEKRFKRPLNIQAEILSWEAIKNCILLGDGLGICPDYVVSDSLANGFLEVLKLPFKNPPYELIALTPARPKLSQTTHLLLDLMKNQQVESSWVFRRFQGYR